eukprot:8707592-Alexandrium_andersonii.AAC.1
MEFRPLLDFQLRLCPPSARNAEASGSPGSVDSKPCTSPCGPVLQLHTYGISASSRLQPMSCVEP